MFAQLVRCTCYSRCEDDESQECGHFEFPMHLMLIRLHVMVKFAFLRLYDLQEGFTALYIAQYLSQTVTTVEWKHILEMLFRVTTTHVSVTVLEREEVRKGSFNVELAACYFLSCKHITFLSTIIVKINGVRLELSQ